MSSDNNSLNWDFRKGVWFCWYRIKLTCVHKQLLTDRTDHGEDQVGLDRVLLSDGAEVLELHVCLICGCVGPRGEILILYINIMWLQRRVFLLVQVHGLIRAARS